MTGFSLKRSERFWIRLAAQRSQSPGASSVHVPGRAAIPSRDDIAAATRAVLA